MINKMTLKRILGEIPLSAELYWHLTHRGNTPPGKNFSLELAQKQLPIWVQQAVQARPDAFSTGKASTGKSILIFATLRYWIEHAVLLGIALAGLGNKVTLAYYPYANWRKPINRFDLRLQNAYARSVLQRSNPLIKAISFLDFSQPKYALPEHLENAIQQVSARDVQYTLQIEQVDRQSELYKLRLQRNTQAAFAALNWLQTNRPDILLTPNGSILEMGAVYQVARYLDIPAITYEFGEQRGRIWLAQNAEVMQQGTDDLWAERAKTPLSNDQLAQIQALFASRQRASLWGNFARRWQGVPNQGGEQLRQDLGLDTRPVILLAANVIGDSLTLGRQVFTENMTEWLKRTILEFAHRQDAQLVLRIHPGERYTQGPSVADLVRRTLTSIPEQIHIIEADDLVNTYDLIELADIGLVYTTTVGLEMAMSGVPVIVVGQTHYRGKGFTNDPDSWDSYLALLEKAISAPRQNFLLEQQPVELAWNYAYRFFFEYPCPFPWHLLDYGDALESWPISRVLSDEGLDHFGNTFRYLAGEKRNWSAPPKSLDHTQNSLLGDVGFAVDEVEAAIAQTHPEKDGTSIELGGITQSIMGSQDRFGEAG